MRKQPKRIAAQKFQNSLEMSIFSDSEEKHGNIWTSTENATNSLIKSPNFYKVAMTYVVHVPHLPLLKNWGCQELPNPTGFQTI